MRHSPDPFMSVVSACTNGPTELNDDFGYELACLLHAREVSFTFCFVWVLSPFLIIVY